MADWDYQAAFFLMDDAGVMGLYSNGYYTRPYVANQWYAVTLNFDWSGKTVSYYVDGTLVYANVPFRDPGVSSLGFVSLYNYQNTTAWWDEFSFGSDTGFQPAGTVVSSVINPGVEWQTLNFNVTTPAQTSLTVDILDNTGKVLATNVSSGTNLKTLGIPAVPIRLRGNLATTDANVSPSLLDWAVGWINQETLESDWSATAVSTQDNTAPLASMKALITGDTTPALQGTVDDPSASLQVSLNGATFAAVNNHNGTWTLPDNAISPALPVGPCPVVLTVTDEAGNQSTTTASITIMASTYFVADRLVFYSGSALAAAGHDFAIATDKRALLPGQVASFANYTSYERGLTGVMIDLFTQGPVTLADFQFTAGGSAPDAVDPAAWSAAPAPESLLVRPGEGIGGTTRIEIRWADNALQNRWLRVALRANAVTGLLADDVFYFGNAIGETGDSASDARVTVIDEIATRVRVQASPGIVTIAERYDFNRDGTVNAADEAIVHLHQTNVLDALQLLAAPAPQPSAPAPFSPPDTNGDGKIDAYDLNTLASNWQLPSGGGALAGDFNKDGKVDAFDLNALALHWQEGVAAAPATLTSVTVELTAEPFVAAGDAEEPSLLVAAADTSVVEACAVMGVSADASAWDGLEVVTAPVFVRPANADGVEAMAIDAANIVMVPGTTVVEMLPRLAGGWSTPEVHAANVVGVFVRSVRWVGMGEGPVGLTVSAGAARMAAEEKATGPLLGWSIGEDVLQRARRRPV
jgi:hypothetical protein